MSLGIRPLELDGVLEILPGKFGDDRGFFSETWNAERLSEAGIDLHFIQDNHSYSAASGVLRGQVKLPRGIGQIAARFVQGSQLRRRGHVLFAQQALPVLGQRPADGDPP